jgi:hypothetical protein
VEESGFEGGIGMAAGASANVSDGVGANHHGLCVLAEAICDCIHIHGHEHPYLHG